jgi:hypothetical protein
MTVNADFTSNGFALLRGIVSPDLRSFAKDCMDLSYRAGRIRQRPVARGQYEEYAPLFGETLLERLLPIMESSTGYTLSPTYSFWRLYQGGASLERHTDRLSCELSVSINIAVEPPGFVWPLWVRDLRGNEVSLPLLPGDGAIYKGCELPHWRSTFEGQLQYQMFLHYVRADGPNARLKFDGRRGLATPYGEPGVAVAGSYTEPNVRCVQVSAAAPNAPTRVRSTP